MFTVLKYNKNNLWMYCLRLSIIYAPIIVFSLSVELLMESLKVLLTSVTYKCKNLSLFAQYLSLELYKNLNKRELNRFQNLIKNRWSICWRQTQVKCCKRLRIKHTKQTWVNVLQRDRWIRVYGIPKSTKNKRRAVSFPLQWVQKISIFNFNKSQRPEIAC